MRRSVPNWLISSGRSAPLGLSNSSAGPPALTVRSTISVISRCGSTSAETRTSSPSRSSSAIQERRSDEGAIGASVSRSLAAAAMPQPVRGLTENDHGEEDQAHDEHRRDHLLPFGGGVCKHEREQHRGATLTKSPVVRRKRVSYRRLARAGRCERGER